MGQKINPIGFRTGITYPTKSVWFATKKNYAKNILEDFKIRKFLSKKLDHAGLTHVEIKRSINNIDVFVHISRPGVVIGRGGTGLELLKKDLDLLLSGYINKAMRINIHPVEVKSPDLSATLVVKRIISQLEHRYPHRRAANQAIEKVMSAGAKGVKIKFAGRIGGAEIGRTDTYKEGRIPSQTIRAKIDYYEQPALTRSGFVGIKVWIFTGETK